MFDTPDDPRHHPDPLELPFPDPQPVLWGWHEAECRPDPARSRPFAGCDEVWADPDRGGEW